MTIITHPPRPGEAPRRLVEGILGRSVSGDWAEARQEWELVEVYFQADPPGACLCGHPITEHCLLVNQLNGNEVVVGNVCVTRFMGLDAEVIFRSLRRVIANNFAALNARTVEHLYNRGYLTDWERRFYLDTWRKRKLSERQREKRAEINVRMLALTVWEGVQRAG
jgi:hypothetical protein